MPHDSYYATLCFGNHKFSSPPPQNTLPTHAIACHVLSNVRGSLADQVRPPETVDLAVAEALVGTVANVCADPEARGSFLGTNHANQLYAAPRVPFGRGFGIYS